MAKDQNSSPEVKDVKPTPDLNGEVSLGAKPDSPKPEENPGKAAEALKGSIKETILNVNPVAETIDGKTAGAALSNRALHMSPAGALLDSAVDDRSRIREPRTPDRPGNIYDKNSFSSKIPYMNVGCEQAKSIITHAPTIFEDPKQGAYSQQIPFQEYSNKRRGEAPQSQLFFRSMDFERTPYEYLYSMGQLVDYVERNPNVTTALTRRIKPDQDYPAVIHYLDSNEKVQEGACSLANTRGNYILKGIDITVTRDASGREYFSGLSFVQDKLKVITGPNSTKRINLNLETETNIETQRVLKLVNSDLIKPNSPDYNEFANALGAGRKQYFNLYSDIEGDTGFLAMMAYRFANIEYASINARLAKAGSDESNIDLVKYFITNDLDLRSALHTDQLDSLQIYNDVFLKNHNDRTLPMIPWYRFTNPSIRQFSNWSTLLTNNNTPKKIIDKAEKVLESFYVKPEAWNFLKNTQLYSTTDGYNPNCPIIMTPGYKVIIREDLNLWSETFDRSKVTDINLSGTGNVYSQAWCQQDRKNVQVNLKHPFVDGLLYFLVDKEDELLVAFGGVDGIRKANGQSIESGASTAVIHYNFDFTVESFNPVCFLILAALPYMARIRNNNTFRIPDMWEKLGNPATDHCVTASAGLALAASNFSVKDYAHAIEVKQMSDIGKFRYLYPERFNIIDSVNVRNNVGANNSLLLGRYVELPWYMTEDSVDISAITSGLISADEQKLSMNYPIIRQGLTHSDVNFFKKFTPRETRLILDQLVEVPRMHISNLGNFGDLDDATGFLPKSMYALRHDEYTSGRVVLGYETKSYDESHLLSPDNYDITIIQTNVLQTPRELGFFGGYAVYSKTIVDGATGCSLSYDSTDKVNVITFEDTISTPVDDITERIDKIQKDMGTIQFEDDDENLLYSEYDVPVGAGVYGESYDLYWNQYDTSTDAGMQIAAGYLQIYDRVYNLYSYSDYNYTVLHNHEMCLGLGFNYAPFDNGLHNRVHDIYQKDAYKHDIASNHYYDDTPSHGYKPYPELTTSTATRCLNTMLSVTFKPYNYMDGIEIQRAIKYGTLSTDPTVVKHSAIADHQLDLFEMAYYFNFVGFDATYYVNDVNDRMQQYNDLNDGYTKDYFISNSPVLQ